MVAPGNISRIGSFRAHQRRDGGIELKKRGFALEPKAPYELRDAPGGYGCEDPRVTFIKALDRYVMAYVAFGPAGPEVAVAISQDGLEWERLGPVRFEGSDVPIADKDAAFFPEPILSPNGVPSFAIYHRPTFATSAHEGIAIGYVSVAAAQVDLHNLCTVTESHILVLPEANWGKIKVGAGTPPIRIREGWLALIHGVDEFEDPSGAVLRRYCAGVIIHDAEHIEQVIFRSSEPLFVPEVAGEMNGTVGHVVFPTGIDAQSERVFDIYYGMADYEIGRGRLVLHDHGPDDPI
jgi:predicted GH43/DUF377 family glycosyl hydrolase